MAKAPTIKLNDGNSIPVIGLGTYAREGSKNKECQKAVEAALKCGFRHIDTASFYDNEEEVGQGLKNAIGDGVVKRDEIFVTTKLWNDCHEYDQVIPTLKDSLKKLGLSYVDLYLIHWPIGDVDYLETWRGFEKCQELGLAKSIGVSNFNIQQLERVLANCKIPPAVNQVEINLNNTQKPLIKFCKERNIAVTAYSPFGSMVGYRSDGAKYPPRLDDPLLSSIGKKYNKSATQIALRYLIDCGLIAIPKSVTPSRLAENIDIFDFELTKDEIEKLDAFNKDYRVVAVTCWKDHKYYPF